MWVQPDGLAEFGVGLVQLALIPQDVSQAIVKVGVLGRKFHRFFAVGERLVQLPLKSECPSQLVQRRGIRTVLLDECTKLGDEFVQFALTPQGAAKVGIGIEPLRVKDNGEATLLDRLVELSVVAQGPTEVVVKAPVLGGEVEG